MKANAEARLNRIFQRVLKEIKPTKKELEVTVSHVNDLTSRLRAVIPKDVEIRVIGSIVKGTQLGGDSDIDMFLLFNKRLSKEKITKLGVEWAKSIVRSGESYEIKYAEHPYVRLYLRQGIKADIVPAFKIENVEEIATAVDRSPAHAEYINSHLNDKQRDDVRLLKHLLDAHGIYGAEITTSGFSGYLCELLINTYGSLQKLLEAASLFTIPIVVDPKNKSSFADAKLTKRFNSQFIVIDPVDQNRNVAAGTSSESLSKFVALSRRLIARPSREAFGKRGSTPEKAGDLLRKFLRETGLEMFIIETKLPDKSEDVLWPQLRKASGVISGIAAKSGFRIYLEMQLMHKRRGLIVFFAPKELLKSELVKGPSVFMEKAHAGFMKSHEKSFGTLFIGENAYALRKNRYGSLESYLRAVTMGSVISKRKDVLLKGSWLLINRAPGDYTKLIYDKLMEKLSV